jgi:hypothetical protein
LHQVWNLSITHDAPSRFRVVTQNVMAQYALMGNEQIFKLDASYCSKIKIEFGLKNTLTFTLPKSLLFGFLSKKKSFGFLRAYPLSISIKNIFYKIYKYLKIKELHVFLLNTFYFFFTY